MQTVYLTLVIILAWFGMDTNDYPGTTAIWVSLEGCYRNLSQSSSHNLTKNGPRHCFDACPNSTYIGLQDSWCMCDTSGNYFTLSQYCNSRCSGELDMLCGSGPGIAVYSKANPAQSINVSGDFGCVYVDVSVPSNGIGHIFKLYATNNCSEEYGSASFEGLYTKCIYERLLVTWFKARDNYSSLPLNKFFLPEQYVRDDRCPPQTDQGKNILDGKFWIGMIWIAKDMTTTSMTTMAMTSTRLITTTTTRTEMTTKDQSTKRLTATSSTIVSTTQGLSPSIDLTAVYIAVPVGVCVVSVVVVIICWCRKCCCFRACREGVETANLNKAQDANPLKDINTSSSVQLGSTRSAFQEHPDNGRPIMARQTHIQEGQYEGSNRNSSDQEMGSITPNRLEDPSVKPGTSYIELHESRQSSMSIEGKGKVKRKKKKKKNKKKKKKEKHQVNATNKSGEIDCNVDNHAGMDINENDVLSVVNEVTENPNNESKEYGKKKKKKKKKQREYSCSNEESNTSAVTYETNRPGTASGGTIRVSADEDIKWNDQNSDSIQKEKKKHKRSRKGEERASNRVVPADHPVLEKHPDLSNTALNLK